MELRHRPSGIKISFCALEALRAWVLLDHPPIPHLNPKAASHGWDYTYTTAYCGATAVASFVQPPRPDGRTFYRLPASSGGGGPAAPKLHAPLCQCADRTPLAALALPPPCGAAVLPSAPPPWRLSSERVDIGALLRANAAPLLFGAPWPFARMCDCSLSLRFSLRRLGIFLTRLRGMACLDETVDLWQDNLDPHSFSSLSARVVVGDGFWAAYLRCFVRVNGALRSARPPGLLRSQRQISALAPGADG
eukprot:SAG11_NODE_1939_length_4028_cov_1.658946_2_plen_249_part_00